MSVEVKNVVDKFVKDDKLFTSVDISNQIKEDGEWISNRTVSFELNNLFNAGNYPNYKISSIQVKRAEDDVMVRAILYMPIQAMESDYTNTKAKPMTPDDFDFNHGEIELDDVEENDEDETKDEDNEMKDTEENKDTTKKAKPSFTKSKRNYKRFNFL